MKMRDAQSEEMLRKGFRYVNRAMLLMWRLGLGKYINLWPKGTGQIMVLTTTGRKSGIRRRTPVNYALIEDEIYCTAGFGKAADWYGNLRANPLVEVWLPDSWYSGIAEDVTGCPGHIFFMRQVMIASAFAGRAAGVDPDVLSDDELARLTADYRLVRIHRTAPLTGPGGPGDLAWVWPAATLALLPLALFGRGKPKAKRLRK
jgi:deazaflavin-dependent oxidoreductase (nitroreductase family)